MTNRFAPPSISRAPNPVVGDVKYFEAQGLAHMVVVARVSLSGAVLVEFEDGRRHWTYGLRSESVLPRCGGAVCMVCHPRPRERLWCRCCRKSYVVETGKVPEHMVTTRCEGSLTPGVPSDFAELSPKERAAVDRRKGVRSS